MNGLPLRRAEWKAYLDWAVDAFRLASSPVRDETQIHTHMCYSEFNDIIDAIGAMDADVVSIETSRSRMELLEAFATYGYPNEKLQALRGIPATVKAALDDWTEVLGPRMRPAGCQAAHSDGPFAVTVWGIGVAASYGYVAARGFDLSATLRPTVNWRRAQLASQAA